MKLGIYKGENMNRVSAGISLSVIIIGVHLLFTIDFSKVMLIIEYLIITVSTINLLMYYDK